MQNSADSPPSSVRIAWGEAFYTACFLGLLVFVAANWTFQHKYILYYGDAQAHLNISRSLIDSRTPGYDQLGTVWLPMLHVICLPFVPNTWLWSTGLAGSIPVAACFVIAGVFFYLAARDVFRDAMAAGIVVACFALNPNLLYLASIPMTEVVFLAGLAVELFALFHFKKTQQRGCIFLGVAASWFMTLTRYDGWYLVPFLTLGFFLFARQNRILVFLTFGVLASAAPAYWLAHNYWETGNALDFFNGPYSAKAIQGGKPYPGYRDWALAFCYYAKAGQLCIGWPMAALGIVGAACAIYRRSVAAIAFLLLTPLFYVWSMHSAANPIFLPQLKSGGYYNVRYGIAMLPLAAFAVGSIVLLIPARRRNWALILPVLCVSLWLIHPGKENWIVWKESQVNSMARRGWTNAAAEFLREYYRAGDGIWMRFGDTTGILGAAQLPIAEALHEGNGPEWSAALGRPDLWHRPRWAIALDGDAVAKAIDQANTKAPVYRVVSVIHSMEAPLLRIYRRTNEPFAKALAGEKTGE